MRHSSSSATRRASVLVAAFLILSVSPTFSAHADSVEIVSGIGVFLDDPSAPGTPSTDKAGAVLPGEFFAVHVVTDVAAAAPFPGASGAQFRVEVDPRLSVVSKSDGSGVSLSFETAPDEWDVAFNDCDDGTVHLLTYVLQLPAGETNVDDLRVDVTDPTGKPMAISTCSANARLTRAFSAGGVVLNPTAPSIVHFSRSADVHVEGRDLKLGWETSAATSVTLDGSPVSPTDTQLLQPTVDTSYVLAATNGTTNTEQIDVQVIRTPRVDLFTAELVPPDNTQVRLSWNVQGVDVVNLDGVPVGVGAFGERTVPLLTPPNYQLQAANEWGPTYALATLDDVSQLPPSILSFDLQPSDAPYNTDVTLSWSVFNADQVDISPGIGAVDPEQGSVSLTVTGDQIYTITATNTNGTDTETVTLTMTPPVIVDFSASNTEPLPGDSIDLQWNVIGAETVEIQPDVGFVDPVSGTVTVTPQDVHTSYTLIATSAAGVVQGTVSVDWSRPILAISAPTSAVYAGTDIDLDLTILGADTATLTPTPGPLVPPESQTISLTLNETTLFTLTATNAAGSRAVSFHIAALKPSAVLVVSDDLVPAGTTVTLTATIAGAQSATISPEPGVIDPSGGSFDVVVNTSTIFELEATNPAGTTTTEVEVVVEEEVPVVHSFTADPSTIEELQSSTLSWDVSGATLVEINPIGHSTTDLQGTLEVSPTTTTTYELVASNTLASATANVTVQVNPNDLQILYFLPSPETIVIGESASLLWHVVDADHITIEPGGFTSTAPIGSVIVSPTETTEYTLTAFHGPVSLQATATVEVGPFRINSFEASPLVFEPGESVTLSWNVSGVADVSIDGFGPQPLVGSLVDNPTDVTTYTLRVQNGPVEETRQVTVVPGTSTSPPGLVLSSDPLGQNSEVQLPGGIPVPVYAVLVGGYADGVLGVEYGIDAHPNVLVVAEDPILVGSTDSAAGYFETNLQLAGCELTTEPVAIVQYHIYVIGPVLPGETILALRGWSGAPQPTGPQVINCWGGVDPVETLVDLTWDDAVVPVLSIDLELDNRRDGRLVRWEMNGEPEQLTVYRGSAITEMEAIHTMAGRAAGEWTDASAQMESADYYRIEARLRGETVSSAIVQAKPATPSATGRTRLLANVPNPFNPSTQIHFVLEKPGAATVDIYDLQGRRVFHRPFSGLSAGEHSFVWSGLDVAGRSVSSGVYLVQLRAEGKMDSRSITLVE